MVVTEDYLKLLSTAETGVETSVYYLVKSSEHLRLIEFLPLKVFPSGGKFQAGWEEGRPNDLFACVLKTTCTYTFSLDKTVIILLSYGYEYLSLY
jgi:hypothetical protein